LNRYKKKNVKGYEESFNCQSFAVLFFIIGYAHDPGVRLAGYCLFDCGPTGDSNTAPLDLMTRVVWKGLEGLWLNTGDARYYKYVQPRWTGL